MTPKQLKARTEKFSKQIVDFCTPLLVDVQARDIAKQLVRAGTAVDANYGSAQRGRTHKEFTSKLGTVLDEASESLGWLELLKSSRLVPETSMLRALHQEADELTRIFASYYKTAKLKEAKDEAERRSRQKARHRRRDSEPPEVSG